MIPRTPIEGGNFRIEVARHVAICRVWRRPDVDSATGASFAVQTRDAFRELAANGVRGMVFDLSEGPLVAGPISEGLLAEMISIFERAHRPIAVVVGEEAVRKLQMERICSTVAPVCGRVFADRAAAEEWVHQRLIRTRIES